MQPKALIPVIAVIAVVAIIVCAVAVNNGNSNNNEPERIGIIGAMDPEVSVIKEAMTVDYTKEVAGMDFFIGKLHGHDVVVVQCGIGKVNAGVCAQTLISDFNVKSVINTGVAGSLDDRLEIGNYVVSKDAVQHDFDLTPIGYPKGEIPYTGLYAFEADKTLIAKAENAIRDCIGAKFLEGRVCSGDQFISSHEQKERILNDFGGLCAEMEGGSIAHVCHLNKTPFVIIRAMSDKADGSAPEDYEEFSQKIAKQCAQMVIYMIDHFDDPIDV